MPAAGRRARPISTPRPNWSRSPRPRSPSRPLLAANPELTAGDGSPFAGCALVARRVMDDSCRLRRPIHDYRNLIAALGRVDHDSGGDDTPF